MVLVMGDQLLLRARLHREQAGGVMGSMGVCTDEVVTVGAGGYSGLSGLGWIGRWGPHSRLSLSPSQHLGWEQPGTVWQSGPYPSLSW